jgi:Ni/Co efflux regulator RcnB
MPHGPPAGSGPPRGPPDGWDERRHDGYWAGGRWYYGPPPAGEVDAPGFRPGFAPWRRGGALPPYYQGGVVSDYSRYHLRRPPSGYNWVRAGDAYLLVSSRTGLIFDVVEGF